MLSKKQQDILTILGLIATILGSYFAYRALDNSPSKIVITENNLGPKKEAALNTIPDKNEDRIIETVNPAIPQLDDTKCMNIEVFDTALEAAKSVFSTTKRDEILGELAVKSLCINNADITKSAVKRIYSNTKRDNVYIKIIDEMVRLQKFEDANLFASYIYSTTARDNAKEKIIAKMY